MVWCHSSIQDEGVGLTGVVIEELHGVTVAPGLPDQGAVCRVEIGVGGDSNGLGGSQTIFVIGVRQEVLAMNQSIFSFIPSFAVQAKTIFVSPPVGVIAKDLSEPKSKYPKKLPSS